MKKFSKLFAFTAFVLTVAFLTLPVGSASASMADGTYSVPYEMKEKSSDSTSIADGYFSSPATLTVKDGVQEIQLTVTGADMIKKLVAPSGPVTVVSESGDSRTVTFKVDGDLSKPLSMQMDIVVPDLYDTTHTARAVFDVSNVPAATTDGGAESTRKASDDSGEKVVNPPTGDSAPIALYITLLLASVAIFTVYKLRLARN